MADEVSIRIYDRTGLCVAGISGPEATARQQAAHYVMMYASEGPLKVRERKLKSGK